MTIVSVTTAPYEIALREPFVTSLRRVTAFSGVLVAIRDGDGRIGIGESVPTLPITGETLDGIVAVVEGPLRGAIVGSSVDELDAVLDRMSQAIVGNPSAKAAVDIALHDLWARELGAPLHRLLGGATAVLRTDMTISLARPDEMADAAARRVAEGFSVLKVKLGGPPELDFERLVRIRERIRRAVTIRVDANQAWTAKQAVALIRRIEDGDLGVELIEQPVRAADLDGLTWVTDSVTTPIMADESCFSPRDVIEIVRRRAADAINVKLMKCGGIRGALSIAHAAGIVSSIGSMMEGTVSASAAACLAAARAEVSIIDLDAPLWALAPAIAGGASWQGETIVLSDEPGLGHHIPPSLGGSD